MPKIMADHNIEGQLKTILHVLESDDWNELWADLECTVYDFKSFGLIETTPDNVLWNFCQVRQIVLITANRNRRGEDSLEATIRNLSAAQSLPVVTIAKPGRVGSDSEYTVRAAIRLLDILMNIDHHLGAGRLYIP